MSAAPFLFSGSATLLIPGPRLHTSGDSTRLVVRDGSVRPPSFGSRRGVVTRGRGVREVPETSLTPGCDRVSASGVQILQPPTRAGVVDYQRSRGGGVHCVRKRPHHSAYLLPSIAVPSEPLWTLYTPCSEVGLFGSAGGGSVVQLSLLFVKGSSGTWRM
jgi:hypothetical protein